MSECFSDMLVPTNVYEEVLNNETSLDFSNQNLLAVPKIPSKIVCALYLQNNQIKELPEDFFPSLPGLMWLDLRDNQLSEIPKTIVNHPSLTHFLLQNNKLTKLPAELGTVTSLKVLHLTGNNITFPPADVVNAGISKLISFLYKRHVDNMLAESKSFILTDRTDKSELEFVNLDATAGSYNSVLDGKRMGTKPLSSVVFSEKEIKYDDDTDRSGLVHRCRKLPSSRSKPLPPFCHNAKYVKSIRAPRINMERMKNEHKKNMMLKKKAESLAAIEKTLQDRKNIEVLKNWRQEYRYQQIYTKKGGRKLEPKDFPYDTSLEYMTLLSREDIEKDLPDKYRKKLTRRSKPSTARRNNADVHLAMKIKELFENLEAIDLGKEVMSPRTEQKTLLNEIQKITEIKQKLDELSTNNTRSVIVD